MTTHGAIAVPVLIGALLACQPAASQPVTDSRGQARLTIAAVVELPGTVRIDETGVTALLVASDAESVSVLDQDGKIVTVPRPNQQITGAVIRTTDRVVTIARAGRPAIDVPRAAIVAVERRVRSHSRRFAVGVGLTLGAGGGAVIGYSIGAGARCAGLFAPPGSPAIYPCLFQPDLAYAAIGALAGGGLGALVGSLVPLKEHWEPASVESFEIQ